MTPRPFTFEPAPADLDRVLARVREYDWAALPDAGGWTAGISRDLLQRLCRYWVDTWTWEAARARMFRHTHVTAEVDGQTVHAVHERPANPGPHLPLVLLHGWPGSYLEYDAVIDPLLAAGVEVIVPSLPGYGFSAPLAAPIGPRATAALLDRFVTEHLGHDRYIVHGSDWGSYVASWMGVDRPGSAVALHLAMLSRHAAGVRPESPEELEWARRREAVRFAGTGYHHEQSTRPQTLGAALADSPVGTAAWIVEKYAEWSDLPEPDAVWDAYGPDALLDVVMLYLLGRTMVTSTWMYFAAMSDPSGFPHRLTVPTGFAEFRETLAIAPPRSLAEQTYPIVQWLPRERGGHFAGYEAPDLLVDALLRFLDRPEIPR